MDTDMSDVLVAFADDRWHTPDLSGAEAVIVGAVRAVLVSRAAADVARRRVEIGVRLTNDQDIQALNRDWRGQDKPTNVLAFALDDDGPCLWGAMNRGSRWVISLWRLKPVRGKPAMRASRSPTISAIWLSMVHCICWGMITTWLTTQK